MARALAQAHHLPGPEGPIAVIHRDVKPDHVFVARVEGAEVLKILDFGIARTKSAATLHAGRTTMGAAFDAFTPGYASPEQWLPKRHGQTGPWTDVWGLALTMVEALSGKPAIDGDMAAMMGTALDEVRRPTPRTEGATVSDAIEAAFARALAVDPRQRTQSIEAFWTELEVALGLAPTLSSRPGSAPGHGLALGSEPPPAMPGAPAPVLLPARAQLDRLAAAETLLAAQTPAPAPRPRPDPPAEAPSAPRLKIELAAPVRRREEVGTLAPDPGQRRRMVDLRERLRTPGMLVLLALAIGGADAIYVRATGELLMLGEVRPVWIAGPLALMGVALGCWRILDAW